MWKWDIASRDSDNPFYCSVFGSKGKANPRVWRHEIMERDSFRRGVRYGHGAAAFPMSIMEVLFGSLCLRDETIRGSVIFKVCWEHVNATLLCRIKPLPAILTLFRAPRFRDGQIAFFKYESLSILAERRPRNILSGASGFATKTRVHFFQHRNLLWNRSLASKVSFCREAPILVKAVVSIELSFSPAREIRFKGIFNRGLDSIILYLVIEAHLSLIGMQVKYPHLAFQTFLHKSRNYPQIPGIGTVR